jgi:hypothetical protein
MNEVDNECWSSWSWQRSIIYGWRKQFLGGGGSGGLYMPRPRNHELIGGGLGSSEGEEKGGWREESEESEAPARASPSPPGALGPCKASQTCPIPASGRIPEARAISCGRELPASRGPRPYARVLGGSEAFFLAGGRRDG